jgi:phospholipase/carboxylesterase
MSGYLHPDALTPAKSEIPPTLITHGRYDEVVPLKAALKAQKTLESLEVAVEYHEFDMGHEINPQTLEVLRNFVVNRIG